RNQPAAFTDAAEALKHFTDGNARIRLLFRPAKTAGAEGFFLVAAAPAIDGTGLDKERQQLLGQGVLDRVGDTCSVRAAGARRYLDPGGREEILTSVVPMSTPAGCWTLIFSYPLDDLPGRALGTPYWQRAEVQRAFVIYLCLALLTLVVFLAILRSVRRFGRLAPLGPAGACHAPGRQADPGLRRAERDRRARRRGGRVRPPRRYPGPDGGKHPPAGRGQRACLQDADRDHAPVPGAAAPRAA